MSLFDKLRGTPAPPIIAGDVYSLSPRATIVGKEREFTLRRWHGGTRHEELLTGRLGPKVTKSYATIDGETCEDCGEISQIIGVEGFAWAERKLCPRCSCRPPQTTRFLRTCVVVQDEILHAATSEPEDVWRVIVAHQANIERWLPYGRGDQLLNLADQLERKRVVLVTDPLLPHIGAWHECATPWWL